MMIVLLALALFVKEYMIGIAFEFITGFTVGIEHDTGYEEDDYNWVVAFHLGIFRIMIINFKPERI